MRGAAVWAFALIVSCLTPNVCDVDCTDPLLVHYEHARAAFAVMCDCAQDVVAIADYSDDTAWVSGDTVRYNPRFITEHAARFGPTAAFTIFAHELAHIERRRLYADRLGTFSEIKVHELECDRRAGCAVAIAGLPEDDGAASLAWFGGDIRHFSGDIRAAAFRLGYGECD
jgi:hypothetical protein